MQIVFCPRTGWDGRSATGMTSSLRMTSGDDCRGRQYSRAAAQLMSTSAALPEIRDEQENPSFVTRCLRQRRRFDLPMQENEKLIRHTLSVCRFRHTRNTILIPCLTERE